MGISIKTTEMVVLNDALFGDDLPPALKQSWVTYMPPMFFMLLNLEIIAARFCIKIFYLVLRETQSTCIDCINCYLPYLAFSIQTWQRE